MDTARFQEGQQAYDAGDYRAAAKAFLAAAEAGGERSGAAFHMAGNALMRLRRYRDAVTVYGHALGDETYEKRGALRANLGQAHLANGDYADAVGSFEAALQEPDYTTPYKARQGLAGALLEMGRTEEAAAAYRAAGVDPENPDPGKALVNLGLCFMALGRPEDAAEAYKAALGFEDYEGRGKALANLGQAFAASGRNEDAVRAFKRAEEVHGYQLSAAAAAAYEIARRSAEPEPARETVEGWETGEMTPAQAETDARTESPESETVVEAAEAVAAAAAGASAADVMAKHGSTGWSTEELQGMTGVMSREAPPTVDETEMSESAEQAARELGFGDEQAVSEFFSRTEEEMRAKDRETRSAEKASSASGRSPARLALIVVAITAAVVIVLGVAWGAGMGWPTQSQTVRGLFQAQADGEEVVRFWVAVPDADVDKEMAKIPPTREFSIDEVDRAASESVVRVTVTPEKGAPLRYSVTLAREGVGWKVIGIDNDWRSTEETSGP